MPSAPRRRCLRLKPHPSAVCPAQQPYIPVQPGTTVQVLTTQVEHPAPVRKEPVSWTRTTTAGSRLTAPWRSATRDRSKGSRSTPAASAKARRSGRAPRLPVRPRGHGGGRAGDRGPGDPLRDGELAKEKGARFVLASSSEVYGEPLEHPQRE